MNIMFLVLPITRDFGKEYIQLNWEWFKNMLGNPIKWIKTQYASITLSSSNEFLSEKLYNKIKSFF